MASNIQKMGQSEACQLINSTPLGEVMRESHLRYHRTQAGMILGSGKQVNLLAYAAWLIKQRHVPKAAVGKTPPPVDLQDTAESAHALVQQLKCTESGKALSSRQLLAIAALVTESSHKAAACKVGISPNTLCRWLKQSEFKAAHDLICRQLHESVFARAQAASGMAMNALLQIAQHSPRNSDRIQAIRIIYDVAGSATQRISPRTDSRPTATMRPNEIAETLSHLIREMEQSSLGAPEKARLINSLSSTLLTAIEVRDLAMTLEDLEREIKRKPGIKDGDN